ncbi:MAG: hypothetical protein LBQ57_13360 [Spirochaetales bacterium]|nr:hypothetical protein [Spirochaetales bacterium]
MKITIVGKNPEKWYKEKAKALVDYSVGISGKMEQWAKANASSPKGTKTHVQADGRTKWIDRSGDARDFLRAGVDANKDGFSIWIGHGKEYGKYLEECHDNKYAICGPTIKHYTPIINAAVKRIFGE